MKFIHINFNEKDKRNKNLMKKIKEIILYENILHIFCSR